MDVNYAKYLLDKTKQDYNLIAEDFSRTRFKIWPELEIVLSRHFSPEGKVLDLGCGNGRFFEYFKNKDIEYFGVDGSDKLISIAQKIYPGVNFQAADALTLPFPEGFFDRILSIAVFHHIPSQELRIKFLEESKRVLKPGGILLLTVWNFKEAKEFVLLLKSFLMKLLGLSKMDFGDFLEPWANKTKRYYHYFRKGELVKLAKAAGFDIVKIGLSRNEKDNRRNTYLVLRK
jgi:tRNA (uracil-5-)-methyltransferase TRM9